MAPVTRFVDLRWAAPESSSAAVCSDALPGIQTIRLESSPWQEDLKQCGDLWRSKSFDFISSLGEAVEHAIACA